MKIQERVVLRLKRRNPKRAFIPPTVKKNTIPTSVDRCMKHMRRAHCNSAMNRQATTTEHQVFPECLIFDDEAAGHIAYGKTKRAFSNFDEDTQATVRESSTSKVRMASNACTHERSKVRRRVKSIPRLGHTRSALDAKETAVRKGTYIETHGKDAD